jgi:hypothetical protein
MDWYKSVYEVLGAPYPKTSLIVACFIGAGAFGFSWYLIGRAYNKAITEEQAKQHPTPEMPTPSPSQKGAIPMTDEKKSETIPSSINQTMTNSPGGIQAGGSVTINHGVQPRKLTDEQESLFVKFLRGNAKGGIEISCIESGGPEPCDFARQLAQLLGSAGWSVNFSPIMFGAGDPTKTIPEMYILVRANDVPQRATVLQNALKSVGYNAVGIERPDVAPDHVQLTVWFQQKQ